MPLHSRKCWHCGNVAEHKDNIVPEVNCKLCGSQDTRAIKANASAKHCEHDDRFRGVFFATNGCVACELERMAKRRDAWRAACRLLYELMGEGGRNGRPMDALSRGDWGRVIAVIGTAESMDDAGCHSDACPVSA